MWVISASMTAYTITISSTSEIHTSVHTHVGSILHVHNPANLSFYRLTSGYEYVCTMFGVDSSSHVSFTAHTDTHNFTNATDHPNQQTSSQVSLHTKKWNVKMLLLEWSENTSTVAPLISWWTLPVPQRCSLLCLSMPGSRTPAGRGRSWTTVTTAWHLVQRRHWWHSGWVLLLPQTDHQTGTRFLQITSDTRKQMINQNKVESNHKMQLQTDTIVDHTMHLW